jgi:hypothetical protein
MGNKHITIHEAAKQGDSETILFKLSEGIDVDLADEVFHYRITNV